MGSTSSPLVCKYDVFISFRGPDTRNKFICHLKKALNLKGINVYTDDRLDIGARISPSLRKAIKESKLAIVVLSENYASSWWCLDELVHIQKCQPDHRIVPVFYEIEPSYARKLKGKYQDAFAVYEKSDNYPPDDVEEAKNAVIETANLSGIVSESFRPETNLVDKIIEEVSKKLKEIPYSRDVPSNLVGIEKHMKKLEPLLDFGSHDFRIIGIWGMIGIGKTTVATVLYDRFCSKFDGFYFLPNVTREAKAHRLDYLRNELLRQLLDIREINLSTSLEGRLCHKRVLIVLDDVDDEDQYDQLLPRRQIQFQSKSRIIVTTRNLLLLKSIGAEVYKVEALSDFDARKLFNLTAFDKSSNCMSEFADLSDKVVRHHSGGVPLALKILGSYLQCHDSRKEWECTLQKWKSVPHQRIDEAMRICCERLDRSNRDLFLDIACFFRGEDRNFVERILLGCKLYPTSGVKDLIANSLLTITHDNKIAMQDVLQRMAQEIVRKESEKEPESRSRLWIAEDICDILEKNRGTAKLEGIFFDMSTSMRMVRVNPAAFSNMHNLRLLKIYNSRSVEECKVDLPRCLESLPNSLVYFHWHSYPQKSLPPNFAPNGVVELNMPYSRLEDLWPTGAQHLGNLKRIDLSYSEQLIKIPDFSHARTKLESVNLEGCSSLKELPSDISNLVELTSLNLKGCSSLQSCLAFPRNIKSLDLRNCTALQTLPSNVCDLQNLEHLDLSGCCQLKNFPKILRPMRGLKKLILERTPIKELHSSIENLLELKLLSLNMCKNLKVLPRSISNMQSLQRLNLCHCSNLRSLPKLPPSLPWVDARYCTSLKTVSTSKASPGQVSNIFVFYNCVKLDQDSCNNIMADAQRRLLHRAMTTREDGESKVPDVDEICFPGDEIPEWFMYRNEGGEVNVEIDRQAYWSNPNFLGFAFCVVVDFQDVSSDTDFQLHCKSECISSYGKTNKWRRGWTWHWNNLEEKSTINSSHIFVFCDTCPTKNWILPPRCESSSSTSTPMNIDCLNNFSATFCFQPKDFMGHVTSSNCKVQWCGVRLLYTNDLEEFPIDNHPDMETGDPVTPREEHGITHATNDWQRRLTSCECLLCSSCWSRLREIVGRLLEYMSHPVTGSVGSDIDPAYEERLQKVEIDFRNLQSGIERLIEQNRLILEECVNGRRMMKQYFEMNVQVQSVR